MDTWLYWLHRAYHSKRFPLWFRKIHYDHHVRFHRDKKFHLHPTEFLLNVSLPFVVTSYLIHPLFIIVVVSWGWFEAARGHGHYWWFKLIPKSYYKKMQYCGYKYHMYHHLKDETKNLGQFLKIWDKICGTEKKFIS